ncbi:MAG: hypothetical protein PWR21_804 [Methanoculleus sp.]|nr:hypothetical protein [Methanoculleus sp.]
MFPSEEKEGLLLLLIRLFFLVPFFFLVPQFIVLHLPNIPRRAVKAGAVPGGCDEPEAANPPQNGKIAYWMHQMYCTTGIQKW